MKVFARIALPVSLLITLFNACKKPDVPSPDVTTCRIENFTYGIPFISSTYSGVIKYNSQNNPTSVTVAQVSTGNPHALFMYDKFNRVTDHIATYGTTTDPANLPTQFTFETWTRYVYADDNPSSMPVRDTLRTLGTATNGVPTFSFATIIETYVYDAQKRIIQVNASGGNPTLTYLYDANGNLFVPGVTYDTRKSYRKTNKVWMLVDRNFSNNNPFIATQYNSEGYPTMFPAAPSSGSLDVFLRRSMNFKTMEYSCTMNPAPVK